MQRCSAILSLLLVVALSAHAKTDTLSGFDTSGSYKYYDLPSITAEAARFVPRTSGYISSIALIVGGRSSQATARVRVFGNERGAAAPNSGIDLIKPVVIQKSKPGVERIVISYDEPVRIEQGQFFVVVDQQSDGIYLVTDDKVKAPICRDQTGEFGYQCIQIAGKQWWTGQYGYAIDVVYESDDKIQPWLTDQTATLQLDNIQPGYTGQSWYDYNQDGFVDLLVGGRLYQNQGGVQFTDVTEVSGLMGLPRAGVFMDLNHDGLMDLLFIGVVDSTRDGHSMAFIGAPSGLFTPHHLDIPAVLNPTSVSIADANGDSYPDLFVGQGRAQRDTVLASYLLMNSTELGFRDLSEQIRSYDKEATTTAVQGAQWVDIDGDGFADLYKVNQGEDGIQLLMNNGDGSFREVLTLGATSDSGPEFSNPIGGQWHYSELESRLTLSVANHIYNVESQEIDRGVVSVDPVHITDNELRLATRSLAIPPADLRGSVSTVDINNDGEYSLFVASASPCRSCELHDRDERGQFTNVSALAGLNGLAAGPDVAWVDYNNDGKRDLSAFVNGQLHLYQNTVETGNDFYGIDIAHGESEATSVEVVTSAGTMRQLIPSTRGILIQEPSRVTLGVGGETVERVVVHWQDGTMQEVENAQANTYTVVSKSSDRHTPLPKVLTAIRAYPNPFEQQVTISYRIESMATVKITIIDLTGNEVVRVFDDKIGMGTYSVVWNGRDQYGDRVSQGTYLCIVTANDETQSQTIVMKR